jgi:hypothetical protein
MSRKSDNLEILNQLSEYLSKNPDIRFGQALRNIGIVYDHQKPDGTVEWANHFNEEPDMMLKRMEKRKKGHI